MTIAKPSIHVSNSIEFKSINTGGNSAGNGGDGSFKGYVVNAPTLNFDPSNTANGANVHVNTGDHVDQKAYWDAGKASAEAEKLSKAYANANSSGDQSSKSGHDTSKVYANTTPPRQLALGRPAPGRDGRHWRQRRRRQPRHWAGTWTSISTLPSDRRPVRLAKTGGKCRRSIWRQSICCRDELT